MRNRVSVSINLNWQYNSYLFFLLSFVYTYSRWTKVSGWSNWIGLSPFTKVTVTWGSWSLWLEIGVQIGSLWPEWYISCPWEVGLLWVPSKVQLIKPQAGKGLVRFAVQLLNIEIDTSIKPCFCKYYGVHLLCSSWMLKWDTSIRLSLLSVMVCIYDTVVACQDGLQVSDHHYWVL